MTIRMIKNNNLPFIPPTDTKGVAFSDDFFFKSEEDWTMRSIIQFTILKEILVILMKFHQSGLWPAWTPPGPRGDRCSVWSRSRSLSYSGPLWGHSLRRSLALAFAVFFASFLFCCWDFYFSFLSKVYLSWFCFVEGPTGRVGECLYWSC